jgi:transcription initiation factor TFIID TATA-box-binding protein
MKQRDIKTNEIKIVNVIAIVTLTAPLDLAIINERLPQSDFSDKSRWLKLRLKPDNTYIAFYKAGKFLIITKHIERLDDIAQRVFNLLHRVDIDVEIVKIEINNIVLHTKICLNSSLESIVENQDPRKVSFEPEQFLALIYKDWGVSFVLFSSGSCIVAGLKNINDSGRIIQKFREVVGSG